MKEKFLMIFLFALLWSIGFSQTRQVVDSLHQQLSTAKVDTSRIDLQIQLCYSYRLGDADSSVYYGEQAFQASKKINYSKGEILSLGFMSITMGQLGNFPKAFEMAFNAIQIAQSSKQEYLMTPALNAISEVYTVLKDYRQALIYLERAKLVSKATNNVEGLAYAWRDMGIVYTEMNQFDSAEFCESKAIETFDKINWQDPLVYETFGDIKIKSGDVDDAYHFYQKGLLIAEANNERRSSASLYNKIAMFYEGLKKPDSAIYYAKKGLEVSEFISQKKTILEAAQLLSALYEQKKPAEAFRYLKVANAYKDSLFGTSDIQAIQALVTQQEEHQKEIATAKINYQNHLKQYALFAGLGILLLVALILYRNNRQKQKANAVLEKTLTDLKSTQSQLIQSEKMASLGELTAGIAHEIQNPLNFVNNFSDVNKELVDELQSELKTGNVEVAISISNDIKENAEKINHHGKRADAIVKGMLQHSRKSSGQKEPTDINALADEYLRLSYHGLRAKDKSFNATIETDFDKSIGKINIVPQEIGRVLLNLYNNAFYACSERSRSAVNEQKSKNLISYEPKVSVAIKRCDDKIQITVRDNGNGIQQKIIDKIFQPFFTTKPTGEGTGLGLSLSYDIIKAHGGEIKVESKEGKGSKFIIQIPVNNPS